MRPQKVHDEDVLNALTKVFRAKGFEGASLSEIAEETGLKKASLYHRFPEGKKQMAEAVFDFIGEWVDNNIFNVMIDENISPTRRLEKSLANIKFLYNGGGSSCILRTLSMKVGIEMFGSQIKEGMEMWIKHFNELGLAFKQTKAQAKANAVQSLIDIQGSLVVAHGLNDLSIFDKTITGIKQRYK